MDRVALFDVDNTLLDNDAAKIYLDELLEEHVSVSIREKFWNLYDRVREEEQVVDFPAVARQLERSDPASARTIQDLLWGLPYGDFLYPSAIDVLNALTRHATTVILSDGDHEFQPHKLRQAGLWDAVSGRVVLTTHKEEEFYRVLERFPASVYALVDDKVAILGSLKQRIPDRLVTVWVRQGHYAAVPPSVSAPQPDFTVAHIRQLLDLAEVLFAGH